MSPTKAITFIALLGFGSFGLSFADCYDGEGCKVTSQPEDTSSLIQSKAFVSLETNMGQASLATEPQPDSRPSAFSNEAGLTNLTDTGTGPQLDPRPPFVLSEVDFQTFTDAVSKLSMHENETASGRDGAEGGKQVPTAWKPIVLKSLRNGKYCTTRFFRSEKIGCDRTAWNQAFVFLLQDLGDSKYSLLSPLFTRRCADDKVGLTCDRSRLGAWEKFEIKVMGGPQAKQVAFKGGRWPGKWCQVKETGAIICDSDTLGVWETFNWYELQIITP